MALFTITAEHPDSNEIRYFFYDNITSEIGTKDKRPFQFNFDYIVSEGYSAEIEHRVSAENPGRKKSPILLKIQLGLACNFACAYCSQGAVPHADIRRRGLTERFISKMPDWFDGGPKGDGTGTRIEFWGGEPLLYWVTLKPLAEKIRKLYPRATFSIITNGSLLDNEKVEWLVDMGFIVMMSHDGPGQEVRGADPLKNPIVLAAINELRRRLPGRFSINFMLNRRNLSRAAVAAYFEELFGEPIPHGEGELIDAYDEGGAAMSLPSEEATAFRQLSFDEICSGKISHLSIVKNQITGWLKSWKNGKPANVVGQKCGMDRETSLAVDLAGNVLTCQNTSAAAMAPNGKSHRIGHVNDLSKVRLDSATHWSYRDDCASCPVLHACKGSCMFLEGDHFKTSCNNAYNNHIPFFAAAFRHATGYTPIYIDGSLPADRKDLFGRKRRP